MKRIVRCFIILSFLGMITFFMLDIFEVLHKGMLFGFICGAIGTLLQAFLLWKNNRFNAWMQLLSCFIFMVAAVLYFLK